MIRRLFTLIETSLPVEQLPVSYSSIKHEKISIGWLVTAAPCFPIDARNIEILDKPDEFYNSLLTNCYNAKERMILASLYLGNGHLEHKLLDAIKSNKNYQNNKLSINILLDYTRGSRGLRNSRSMLIPLIRENPVNLKLSLYHTPELRGLLKKYVPERWNELIGLQHMKLYIFDDTLIISGANLSNDYFTNRQDRYFVIKDKDLSDFYSGLISRVQEFSLNVDKDDKLTLSNGWNILPYNSDKQYFIDKAKNKIKQYINEAMDHQNHTDLTNTDTWIYPLVQMGQLGVYHDAIITNKILEEAPTGSRLRIATGYFNLTKEYMDTLIEKCRANCDILMAHPKANGFLGAKGLAGGIPYAYSCIAKKFKNTYCEKGQQNRFMLFEYLREGWTYHVKGLWYYPPDKSFPSMTLIGSPNFGERSVKRDLETQVAIVTENEELSKKLDKECRRLYHQGVEAETDRKVSLWVYMFVIFFRSYF